MEKYVGRTVELVRYIDDKEVRVDAKLLDGLIVHGDPLIDTGLEPSGAA